MAKSEKWDLARAEREAIARWGGNAVVRQTHPAWTRMVVYEVGRVENYESPMIVLGVGPSWEQAFDNARARALASG